MTSTHHIELAPGRSDRPPGTGRVQRVVLAALGIGLVLASLVLPLWRAHLVAPQYPGGLDLHAYGNRVEGDIAEIDSLNHYIGMRPFDPADLPEMGLWPLAVAIGVAAVLAATVGRARLRKFALTYLWVLPVAVLAVIQVRLYQYGHALDPGAALRIGDFTPLVVGPTKVWNFTTWTYPGIGLVVLWAVPSMLVAGPRLIQSLSARRIVFASLALVLMGLPAAASEPHQHGQAEGQVGDLHALLAAAPDGGTVLLEGGRYRGNVVIDRPVTLLGLHGAVIEGDGHGSVLTIVAPGTVIAGVQVRGSGPGPVGEPAGIRIEADDVTVEDVVVSDSYIGISVIGASGVRIERNAISGWADAEVVGEAHAVDHGDHRPTTGSKSRGDGIWLWDYEHVLVRGNHIHDVRDGIYLSHGSQAVIDANHVQGSRYAVHSMFARDLMLVENHFERNLSGAVLMYGGPVLALRNTLSDHWSPSTGFGILAKDVTSAQLIENVMVRNQVGLHLDGPTNQDGEGTVKANTIALNAVGVTLYPSARARLSANSLVNNGIQVLPTGGRTSHVFWSDKGWGNYWSTYRWVSEALPGRGAVPHAEGGTVEASIARSPILGAIATSPALRLLRAVEERWGRAAPAAVDPFPLTEPVSPATPAATDDLMRQAVWLAGMLVALVAAVGTRFLTRAAGGSADRARNGFASLEGRTDAAG